VVSKFARLFDSSIKELTLKCFHRKNRHQGLPTDPQDPEVHSYKWFAGNIIRIPAKELQTALLPKADVLPAEDPVEDHL